MIGWLRKSRLMRDDSGGVLLELAVVVPILLILMLGFIDYSRIGFSYVMASKATERAVRLAVVRPPLCQGVPEWHLRGSNTNPNFPPGSPCDAASNICMAEPTVSCDMAGNTPTAQAIWDEVAPMMPTNATAANLRITYEQDDQLGFLGGPYTPVVTVEIQDLDFEFVTPLGALFTLTGIAAPPGVGADYAFPSMSASLPAEALNDGDPI